MGNPHLRSQLKPGETVLDLGSGAGLDAIIASWQVGPGGSVIGVDLNPTMCEKAQAHVAATGMQMECREGSMVVVHEIFRVLRPGGWLSIADIVSAKQLSQSIVNDPKLWAS